MISEIDGWYQVWADSHHGGTVEAGYVLLCTQGQPTYSEFIAKQVTSGADAELAW